MKLIPLISWSLIVGFAVIAYVAIAFSWVGITLHAPYFKKKENNIKLPHKLGLIIVLVLFIPIIIVIEVIVITNWFIKRVILILAVRLRWMPKGKYMLYVHADNPKWKSYEKNKILPIIKKHAVTLNWSERKKWKWNSRLLEIELFKHFTYVRELYPNYRKRTGMRDFNHFIVIFDPWWKPRKITFDKAFKEYEFGKKEKLKHIEHELFGVLNPRLGKIKS